MSLFRRWPSVRWRPGPDDQIIPPGVQADFPEFADDFRVLERELLPQFRALDNEASRRQNQFRLDQVALIFGGAAAAILGAIQVAFPTSAWPGTAEFLVAGGLSAIAFRQRALRPRERYSANRLKAEALRREYFMFLGRVGPFASDVERTRNLIRRVGQILADHPDDTP